MADAPLLHIDDVHTYRGRSYVLQGVTLQLAERTCTGLLGRNGMGKTTLVRTVAGLERARQGSIRLGDTELISRPPVAISRLGIGYVPQGRRVFGSLSVEENLTVVARAPAAHTAHDRGGGWSPDRVYELFPRLYERRRQPAGTLSGGEQQMLAIGRALMTNPRVLLMDEPSEGLAPRVVETVHQAILGLVEGGLVVLLVEQNYRLAVEASSSVYILDRGRVAWGGSAAELDADASVRRELLGT